jgi:hypothetical protein
MVASDELVVRLVEPDGHPETVMIVWPEHATSRRPHASPRSPPGCLPRDFGMLIGPRENAPRLLSGTPPASRSAIFH